MEQGTLSRSASILRGYKIALFAATVLLCELRMYIGTYLNILADKEMLFRMEIRAGELLVLGILLFLILVLTTVPHAAQQAGRVLRRFCTYDYCFLSFLPFWYVMCCVLRQRVTGESSFRENEWWIYITFITSFVFFPFAGFTGAERARKVTNPMMKAVLLPNMVFMAWILWQWLHNVPVAFPSGSALSALKTFSLSVGENRLHTANRALTMLFLCLYLTAAEKGWRKALYVVGGLEYLMVLILTNNRGAWYPAIATCALLVFVAVWHQSRKNTKILRLLLCLFCAVVCVLLLSSLRVGAFRLMEQIQRSGQKTELPVQTVDTSAERLQPQLVVLSSSVKRSPQAPEASTLSVNGTSDDTETVIHNLNDGLSGREAIYRGSFYLMFRDWRHFLFGVTHYDVGEALREACGQVRVQSGAHNFFLQMGVAFGAPVMLLSIAFAMLLVIRIGRVLFRREVPFPGARIVPMVALPLLMADMFDTTLTAGNSLSCAVFYLFAGWTVAIDRCAPAGERSFDGICIGAFTAELAGLGAMIWWLYPWYRTLYSAGAESDGNSQKLLLLFLTVSALLVLFFFGRLMTALLRRERSLPRQCVSALVSALCFAACLESANSQINRLTEQLLPLLEQERPAVEAVQSVEGCSLFVDHLPEIYQRAFGGIRREPFRSEDLVSRQDVVLITDADREYSKLFAWGYLYTEISDRQAVYTRSAKVAEALKAAGYHLTGYYSRSLAVDMHQVDALSFRGELSLSGTQQRAEYVLRLLHVDDSMLPAEDATVVTLSIALRGEETPLAVREVKTSEFDEDGTCTADLIFTLPIAGIVEFHAEQVNLPEGYIVHLQSVHCCRYPEYDTHAEYNMDGKRVREFYFTQAGEDYTLSDGSHGREYDYDNAGNTIAIRYFDTDECLILNTSGFAEIIRRFDAQKKLVREEYYGVDRQPKNISVGYAALEHEYDSQGNILLTKYYDAAGELLPYGSSNFHTYLKTLKERKDAGACVFIAIRDEGTNALTVQLLADLKELGLRTDLSGKFRCSYCAAISQEEVQEKLSANELVNINGSVGGMDYFVTSAGLSFGNFSSIVIDGVDYSKNDRGMNIVVVENGEVTDSVAFDTYSQVMAMTR